MGHSPIFSKLPERARERRGYNGNPGAGIKERQAFAGGNSAAADNDDRFTAKIEVYGKIAHEYPSPQENGDLYFHLLIQ
jgi:hypothetical protein